MKMTILDTIHSAINRFSLEGLPIPTAITLEPITYQTLRDSIRYVDKEAKERGIKILIIETAVGPIKIIKGEK